MAQKPLLDGTGFEAFQNADDNFTELYQAISGISTGLPWENAIFVGKNGDDSYDGTIIGSPKLTFGAAIIAAQTGDVIVCLDAGVYAEDINLKAGVDIAAPYATLQGSMAFAERERVMFKRIEAGPGQIAVVKPSGAVNGRCYAYVSQIVATGNAGGAACLDAGSIINLFADSITVGSGVAIGGLSGDHGEVVVRVGNIFLDADNATAVGCYGNTARVFGMIGSIRNGETVVGTTGIRCEIGLVRLFIGNNGADTKDDGAGDISWIDPTGSAELSLHLTDYNNPHLVSYPQTGINDNMLVPTGGDVAEVLAKRTAQDRDTEWRRIVSGLAFMTYTQDVQAITNQGCLMDVTAAPLTVTLPPDPQAGEIVGAGHWKGDAAANPITVDPGSRNIMGVNEPLEITSEGETVVLVYTEAERGWTITGGSF